MRHKYDALTRQKVWGRVKELWLDGASPPEIGNRMAAEGYKIPNGKEPMSREYVVKTLYYMKKLGLKEEPTEDVPEKSDRLPDTVLGVLTDSTLTDSQKIRMICAYADIQ